MKKYIRTKDTIFEIMSKAGNTYSVTKAYGEFTIVNGKIVVKEADTIEELCDGYVVESDDGWYTFQIINFAIQDYHIRERYQEQNIILYGFIKTNKGLIYVAKMKGVLPNGEIDWELL